MNKIASQVSRNLPRKKKPQTNPRDRVGLLLVERNKRSRCRRAEPGTVISNLAFQSPGVHSDAHLDRRPAVLARVIDKVQKNLLHRDRIGAA